MAKRMVWLEETLGRMIRPRKSKWTHTCFGGERKTFQTEQHTDCPTCGQFA